MTDSEFKKEIASSLKHISFAFKDMCVLLCINTLLLALALAFLFVRSLI